MARPAYHPRWRSPCHSHLNRLQQPAGPRLAAAPAVKQAALKGQARTARLDIAQEDVFALMLAAMDERIDEITKRTDAITGRVRRA